MKFFDAYMGVLHVGAYYYDGCGMPSESAEQIMDYLARKRDADTNQCGNPRSFFPGTIPQMLFFID